MWSPPPLFTPPYPVAPFSIAPGGRFLSSGYYMGDDGQFAYVGWNGQLCLCCFFFPHVLLLCAPRYRLWHYTMLDGGNCYVQQAYASTRTLFKRSSAGSLFIGAHRAVRLWCPFWETLEERSGCAAHSSSPRKSTCVVRYTQEGGLFPSRW